MKNSLTKPGHIALLCVLLAGIITGISGCESNATVPAIETVLTRQPAIMVDPGGYAVKSSVVLNRPQVPILCYHQIRNWTPSDSKRAEDYIVAVDNFRQQMKLLSDNGYHTILPDQLYDYLVHGASLPSKPIMITFDDTRAEQYTIADEELKRYGFKGVYFIMTVSLNRPGYMTRDQVRMLSDEGNIVGSHTWDHSNVKKYEPADWVKQVEKPSEQLEKITGKPINYFAYPFGLWDKKAIVQLKHRGFRAAFQLSEKRDENDPLFTIRRIIVPGGWSVNTLQKSMVQSF